MRSNKTNKGGYGHGLWRLYFECGTISNEYTLDNGVLVGLELAFNTWSEIRYFKYHIQT